MSAKHEIRNASVETRRSGPDCSAGPQPGPPNRSSALPIAHDERATGTGARTSSSAAMGEGHATAGEDTRAPARERRHLMLLAVLGVGAFHLAYLVPVCAPAIVVFLACLVSLAGRLGSARRAFNWGIVIGLAIYVPHLHFFWNVFVGPTANALEKSVAILGVCALWMVLPIWLGVFLSLATFSRQRLNPWLTILLIPFLWTGTEYFRSELYALRFSWLGIGYAFALAPCKWLLNLSGSYGMGFLVALAATTALALRRSGWRLGLLAVTMGVLAGTSYFDPVSPAANNPRQLKVAGVQYEFAPPGVVLDGLNAALRAHPETELFVLSEHTFDGPVPEAIRNWCREHQRYLIAGGHDPLGQTNYYNTAFVIGPDGQVVFQQAKCQPVQFFKDGVPAPEQHVWDSPWGKLGICICYDLSYTRVTDELIRQGAQALIVPTMDGKSWGGYQHWLHARIAPTRAAEYGVPIFRAASSGISQIVDRWGGVVAGAPFPGQGEIIAGELSLSHTGNHLLLDRLLAKGGVGVTAFVAVAALVASLHRRRNRRSLNPTQTEL